MPEIPTGELPIGYVEISRAVAEVVEEAAKQVEVLKIPADKQEHAHYLALLHLSLVELGHGMAALLKEQAHSSIPGQFRTMLEGYVDFENLLRDIDYVDNMAHRCYRAQLKLLDHARELPDLRDILDDPEYEERRAHIEDQIAQLNERGRKSLGFKTRIGRVPKGDRYWGMYWQTCQAAHLSISELERRHEVEISDGRISASLFSPRFSREVMKYGLFAAQFIVGTMDKLYEFVDHDDRGSVARLIERLEVLSKYGGEETGATK